MTRTVLSSLRIPWILPAIFLTTALVSLTSRAVASPLPAQSQDNRLQNQQPQEPYLAVFFLTPNFVAASATTISHRALLKLNASGVLGAFALTWIGIELHKRWLSVDATWLASTWPTEDDSISQSLDKLGKLMHSPPHRPLLPGGKPDTPMVGFFFDDGSSDEAIRDPYEAMSLADQKADQRAHHKPFLGSSLASFSRSSHLAATGEFYEQMMRRFSQISDTKIREVAQRFSTDPEATSQFLSVITLHLQHLSNKRWYQALYYGFVLGLSDRPLEEVTSELGFDLGEARTIVQKLTGELMIYAHSVPKQFSSFESLLSYQNHFVEVLAEFEDRLFKDSSGLLEPLKTPHLGDLAHHQSSLNFSPKQLAIFRVSQMAIPTIDQQHLLDLLDISRQRFEALSTLAADKPVAFGIPASMDYPMAEGGRLLFELDFRKVRNLQQALGKPNMDTAAFYHELRTFYLSGGESDLHRQLFLAFVVKLLQPSIVSIRKITHQFHFPSQQMHLPRSMASYRVRFIRSQLISVIKSFQQWLSISRSDLYQSFDNRQSFEDYFYHRLDNLSEEELTMIARQWGVLSSKQLLLFPHKFHRFLARNLEDPTDLSLFFSHILRWNPIPIAEFADLYDISQVMVRNRLQTLIHQFQKHLHHPHSEQPPKILESLYLQFSELSLDQIDGIIARKSFDGAVAEEFVDLVESFLANSSYNTHKTILFFASVLGLSPRSLLEWDQIFASHPDLSNLRSSLVIHHEMDHSFREFLTPITSCDDECW